MAQQGRVHSECYNASNPYHECTESCLRKMAEGKGRKEKKKSDNGSFKKGGELRKKFEGKNVNSACPKASNPYHECGQNCNKRIAGVEARGETKESGILPLKLGAKKKNHSGEITSPEFENFPFKHKVYTSNASFPTSHVSSTENRETENGDHSYSSSASHSGEIHAEDQIRLFDKEQVRSSLLIHTSGILATTGHPKESPKKSPDHPKESPKKAVNSIPREPSIDKKEVEDHNAFRKEGAINGKREGTIGSASDSMNFTFQGIAQALEDSDEEDARSIMSDSSVSVGKYRVKGSVSSILQAIFDKYGDIGAGCQLESIAMRSYNIQCVCFVVQELQSTPILQLTKSKVKEMLAILKDVESAGIDIAWLRLALSESSETLELVSQHRAMEVAKTNCDRDLESTRKQLESQMEDLALKEKAVADVKKSVAETRAHFRELELKASVLSETVGSIKSKVESLNNKSLLDGVL
ncbi:hypothetical protein UlMin_030965 [Ulmus minor]